jgi:hypothetical protein
MCFVLRLKLAMAGFFLKLADWPFTIRAGIYPGCGKAA